MKRRRPFVSRDKLVLTLVLFRCCALIALALSPCFAAEIEKEDDLAREVKRLVNAFAIAEANAADPVSPEQAFYQGAIPGLLRRLDPHSVFFDPSQFEQLRRMQNSEQKGFGSIVSVLPGRVIVLQALPGTPSAKSGMAPGDEILVVNNIRLDRLDLDQLVQLLSESRQRPAKIDVRRPGNARMFQFTLVPEEMQSPSVDRSFVLKPGYGYLRVTSFDEKTGDQIHDGIEKLGGEKLKGLVLDFRANPGGLVSSALSTASLFLQPGRTILSIRGRRIDAKEEKVPDFAHPYTFPVSIIVNEKTASAAEIVAGALQDHDRASIVGVPTFGKGLVQSVFPLSGGTGIALTTGLYYTPSGRSIQKPLRNADFELAETSAHLNEAKEFRTDQGRVVKGGGGIQPDFVVYPTVPSRLGAVLEASGMLTSFATEYLQRRHITSDFQVDSGLLDEFEAYAAGHRIQPTFAEWSNERDFIQARLKAELFNQAFGVDKGDEVDAHRDPQVLKALEVLH